MDLSRSSFPKSAQQLSPSVSDFSVYFSCQMRSFSSLLKRKWFFDVHSVIKLMDFNLYVHTTKGILKTVTTTPWLVQISPNDVRVAECLQGLPALHPWVLRGLDVYCACVGGPSEARMILGLPLFICGKRTLHLSLLLVRGPGLSHVQLLKRV